MTTRISRTEINLDYWVSVDEPPTKKYTEYRTISYCEDPRVFELNVMTFGERGWFSENGQTPAFWQELDSKNF